MMMPRVRVPIVMVHGLFGYGRLRVGPWVLADYFAGLPRQLEAAGNRVFVAQLSPTAGIADRAAQLKAFLDRKSPAEPVHILAHSMGGLDARYMISRLGMAPRVLSLTTLGTPHRGCAFADWALGRLGRLLGPVFDAANVSRQGFEDLTVESCRAFNEQTADVAGVRYFSVAGSYQRRWSRPRWQISARVVEQAEGPCDGLVSQASARWGEEFEVWAGDHMNLINWPEPFVPRERSDRAPEYRRLVGRLREMGM